MDSQCQGAHGGCAKGYVGGPPPSEGETVWIDEDYVFDLLVALCDLLHENECSRTSFIIEEAIDEFLNEMGFEYTSGHISQDASYGFRRASEVGKSVEEFRSCRKLARASVQTPGLIDVGSFAHDSESKHDLQEPTSDRGCTREQSENSIEASNALEHRSLWTDMVSEYFPFQVSPKNVSVSIGDPIILKFRRILKQAMKERDQRSMHGSRSSS